MEHCGLANQVLEQDEWKSIVIYTMLSANFHD